MVVLSVIFLRGTVGAIGRGRAASAGGVHRPPCGPVFRGKLHDVSRCRVNNSMRVPWLFLAPRVHCFPSLFIYLATFPYNSHKFFQCQQIATCVHIGSVYNADFHIEFTSVAQTCIPNNC